MQRIKITNLSKSYHIGYQKNQSALTRAINLFSGREPQKIINVLNNFSMTAEAGEIIGITGPNGSGKSTLLRLIAGILKPDNGFIETNGKIISLLNLNLGLQPRLTMRDNIFLVASLFGLPPKKIKAKMSDIIAFSELTEFINTKLFQFSSGMSQRLAFSIAIHCDPDILLLDEVFEVGDENFRNKSAAKIKEAANKKCCILLTSHEEEIIKKNCNAIFKL